ncbi:LrgB family protein [Ensifer adhaerens]|uniref:LrgB family protein n=1 Tax=Ensifer adhaerens TaxID=106592 RepID=UPI0015693D02|nr:LrgB family protein [Ensifer adhaerens]
MDFADEILVSFLTKSATAGVAMAVSSGLGGNVEPTARSVILTGIFGAVMATPLMQRMKTTDHAARWFAVGVASHRISPPTEIFCRARS